MVFPQLISKFGDYFVFMLFSNVARIVRRKTQISKTSTQSKQSDRYQAVEKLPYLFVCPLIIPQWDPGVGQARREE